MGYENSERSTKQNDQVPSAVNTERAVLAYCLQEDGTSNQLWQRIIDVSGLDDHTDLFFDTNNHAIASIMTDILDKNESISVNLIADRLLNKGYDKMGSDSDSPSEFLLSIQLDASIPDIEELDKSIGVLKSLRQRRFLIDSFDSLYDSMYDENVPLVSISNELERLVSSALAGTMKSLPRFGDLLDDIMEGKSSRYVIPTGFSGIDRAFASVEQDDDSDNAQNAKGGWESGRTYTIAASSGAGKTSTMFRSAREAAENGAVPIIFSLESDKNDVLCKLICGYASAEWSQVRMSLMKADSEFLDVDEKDRANVLEAVEVYRDKFRLLFQDSMLNGIKDIPSVVMNVREEEDGNDTKIVVFIDYLQLLVNHGEDERKAIVEMTRELHNMAQSLDVPIVMLSQVNRLDRGQRPFKSNLYGSSMIEANSDGILLMWRPGTLENPEEADEKDSEFSHLGEDVMMIDLAKNRIGQNVIIRAITDDSRCVIEEIDVDMNPVHGGEESGRTDSRDIDSDMPKPRRSRRSNDDALNEEIDTSSQRSRRSSGGRSARRNKRRSQLDEVGV